MKYFVLFLLHHVVLQTAESIELRIKWSRWNVTNVTFGETIGLIESVSLMMCLAKCQETSGCVAAHVNEENSKCELSAYSPLDGTKSATPRTGWTVFFKERCKEGWIVFENSCYFFGNTERTFHDAEIDCKLLDKNAHLANVETAAENNFIKEYLRSRYSSIDGPAHWFGLTDEHSENDWRHFPSEEVASFFDWGLVQPNQGTASNCAIIWSFLSFQWADEECTNTYKSICEHRAQ